MAKLQSSGTCSQTHWQRHRWPRQMHSSGSDTWSAVTRWDLFTTIEKPCVVQKLQDLKRDFSLQGTAMVLFCFRLSPWEADWCSTSRRTKLQRKAQATICCCCGLYDSFTQIRYSCCTWVACTIVLRKLLTYSISHLLQHQSKLVCFC